MFLHQRFNLINEALCIVVTDNMKSNIYIIMN